MFEKNDKKDNAASGRAQSESQAGVGRGDAAVTAEFDYIDNWGDDLIEIDGAEEHALVSHDVRLSARNLGADDPVTRAMDGAGAYLEESFWRAGQDEASRMGARAPLAGVPADIANSSGAWGYEQPEVSGVFSRYEEESADAESEPFDLFEEEQRAPHNPEQLLHEVVREHERAIRRLTRQIDYQKEILQVLSEMLIGAGVISRHELKRQLRALRE